MTKEKPLPKKFPRSTTDFKVIAHDELTPRWKECEAYVQALEGKYTDLNSNDATGLRESEEKLKQQEKIYIVFKLKMERSNEQNQGKDYNFKN